MLERGNSMTLVEGIMRLGGSKMRGKVVDRGRKATEGQGRSAVVKKGGGKEYPLSAKLDLEQRQVIMPLGHAGEGAGKYRGELLSVLYIRPLSDSSTVDEVVGWWGRVRSVVCACG